MFSVKRLISVILTLFLIFQIPTAANSVEVIESANLLETHSTTEIVNMYPELSAYLAAQFRAFNEDINVEQFNISKYVINSVYLSVLCVNPDIFYVNPKHFNSTSHQDDDILVSIRPFYLFDVEDIPAEIEEFSFAADHFLDGIDPEWSDFYKCRFLHDKLATNLAYVEDVPNADIKCYTAYGAMIDKVAVCEGYTLAYNYLLSKLGIETHYIQSLKAQHSWTLMKLGGKYYHTDLTLDDPLYDTLGRVNHTFFLMSDKKLRENDKLKGYEDMHTDWVSPFDAPDTSYDNEWWRNVNSMIFRVDNLDYYVNQFYGSSIYGAVMKRDDSGHEKLVERITTRWTVYNEPDDAFWERAFCYLAYDGEYFYYNSADQVFRAKPNSSYFEVIYTKPEAVDFNIYGLAFRQDGGLYISLKESPNVADSPYRLASLLPEGYNYKDPEDIKAEHYTLTDTGVKLIHFDVYSANIIIPELIDGNNITELGDSIFMNNSELHTVILPDNLLTIGNAAFYGCDNLESVYIPPSVTTIGKNAFAACPNLSIIGNEGSAAQEYARQYGLHFIPSESAPNVTNPTPTVTLPTTPQTQPTTVPTAPSGATAAPTSSTAPTTAPASKVKTSPKKYILRLTLYEGVSYTLSKKYRVKGTTFKNKNPKIAKISSKGKIKAIKKGKATITAKSSKFTATIKVTVKAPSLNRKKKTLKVGKTFRIKIKGTSKVVTFKSSNKRVATVSYKGTVKAKSKGKATITVKYGKKKLHCKITVV